MSTGTVGVQDTIRGCLEEAARIHTQLSREALEAIAQAADVMTAAIRQGRKVIWFGNGGSATQSQHMAAEFVGRFVKERRALPSIALTENVASITAIANDYAYDQIFVRQLEGLSQQGDVAIGLSTSGSSPSVLAGLERARQLGLRTIGMTGMLGDKMRPVCDLVIVVPTKETARIQEAHLTIGHVFCGLVEDALTRHGFSVSRES